MRADAFAMDLAQGWVFFRVLTPSAKREEAGSRSSLRSSDESGSRLYLRDIAALSRSQVQSIQWIDCWLTVNHRVVEAEAGNLLRFASPKASARNKNISAPNIKTKLSLRARLSKPLTPH
ncbi:MAG: hypothetical protein AAGK70_12910 [Pseudomonadota bacterium]